MKQKRKARVIKITKDDMTMCSSRVIWARLKAGEDEYQVSWAASPDAVRSSYFGQSVFEKAWKECKAGDEVWMYHADDLDLNYFEPISC